MKRMLAIIVLLPSFAAAQDIASIYWSYGCDGYIYHFAPETGEYHIYTKIQVKDKENGEYFSYQMTEGRLSKTSENIYSLTSKDISGKATVEFSDKETAIFSSEQYGQARLWQCDKEKAERLIREANEHFKVCPKNTLNCKTP